MAASLAALRANPHGPPRCCPHDEWTPPARLASSRLMPSGVLEFGFYHHTLDESDDNDHQSLRAASAW
jgi:hypothetical protein